MQKNFICFQKETELPFKEKSQKLRAETWRTYSYSILKICGQKKLRKPSRSLMIAILLKVLLVIFYIRCSSWDVYAKQWIAQLSYTMIFKANSFFDTRIQCKVQQKVTDDLSYYQWIARITSCHNVCIRMNKRHASAFVSVLSTKQSFSI